MLGIHMTVTSTMEAVKVATGGAFPEQVIQFMMMGFCLFEIPKGEGFQGEEHLTLFKSYVEYYIIWIYQKGVLADKVPIASRVSIFYA